MSLIQFIKSKVFIKQLIIAVVAFVIFAVVVIKWLDFTTNHDQKIEVPNLEKMSLKAVENLLEEFDLNYIVIDSARYNPDYPKKSVIDQSPAAGDFVKEGRKIYITLNPSGYEDVEIPAVLGKTKRHATSQLMAVGLIVGTEDIYVKDIAKDVVRGILFQNKKLKEGDKIPRNSVIQLKLGDGEGKERYKDTNETE